MHLLIEGLSARVGGGITRLVGLCNALPRVAPHNRYSIVLSSRYQQALIESMPAAIEVIPVDVSPGLLARAKFLNGPFRRLSKNADAIFAAGEAPYLTANRPLVVMCGNLNLFTASGLKTRIGQTLRRPVLRRLSAIAKKMAFVSAAMRDVAALPAEKSLVVPHGADERFTPREKEPDHPYYLAVSSIYPHKNYDTIAEAYALLPPDVPNLKIAGAPLDAGATERLHATIARHALGARIELLGAVPFESLPPLYRGARALIFASSLESFGLSVIEAMATGVPVIVSDIPVFREICGPTAALYFPPRNPTALAAAILQLDRDAALRERLTREGLEIVKGYTWEAAAELLLTAFG